MSRFDWMASNDAGVYVLYCDGRAIGRIYVKEVAQAAATALNRAANPPPPAQGQDPGPVGRLIGEWERYRDPHNVSAADWANPKFAAELAKALAQQGQTVPAEAVHRAVMMMGGAAQYLRALSVGANTPGWIEALDATAKSLAALLPDERGDGSMIQHPVMLTREEADWLLHHGVRAGLQVHEPAGDTDVVTFLTRLEAKLAALLPDERSGDGK